MGHDTDQATPAPAAALDAFGLDQPDEHWLKALREAENAQLTNLGPYELLSEISRGGQGVVYRARERDTQRIVALKRLLGGTLASYSSKRRLARELQAASCLHHAGIVNVLGIDVAEGQPLLIMNWIDGVPITQWAASADQQRSPRQIIALALEVCDALQHAHQRGVIHRDLKPSNILVDAQGHPHILDFGLAKFAQRNPHSTSTSSDGPAIPSASVLTVDDLFIGTINYASPEQLACRSDAIDVRSDLYQFGLILYEMLTGRLPYRPASTPREALAERETSDPARPSALAGAARGGQVRNRDLDTIVLKSIALNPSDRYQSADALAADLSRFLAGEPIQAQGPSTWYLLRKILRRHRVAISFIAAVLTLALIGGATATILALQLAAAQRQEQKARQASDQVSDFLHGVLASADPNRGADPSLTARELLDRASVKLDRQFNDQPQVKAALHSTIGRSYLGLGLHDQAAAHLQAALQARERDSTTAAADLADAFSGLAELRYAQRDYADAEQASRRALQIVQSQPAPNLSMLARELNNLGTIRRAQGDLDQAESLLREALRIRRELGGADAEDQIAETLNNLGNALRMRGDLPGAEALCREVLEIRTARLGPKHVLLAQSIDNLGVIVASQGRLAEAQEFFNKALAMYREVLSPGHPAIGVSAGNLGSLLYRARRYQDAQPLLLESLTIREAMTPPSDQRTNDLRLMAAYCLIESARYDEAEPMLLRWLELTPSSTAGADGPNPHAPALQVDEKRERVLTMLIDLYRRTGKFEQAAQYEQMLRAAQ